MAKAKDYYKILQISSHATPEEIKIAFRRLARQYHPDLHPNNPFCEEKFKEIAEAYEALINLKNNEQADTHFKSREPSSSSPQDFYLHGIRQALEKNYTSAINSYHQAIKLKPDFLEAYIKRCEAYFYLQQYPKSLEDCQCILRLDDKCFEAYYYQGRSRHKLGYLPGAIEGYTQSIHIQNNSAKAYYYRSFVYEELKEYSKALSDIKKAVNLFKNQEDNQGLVLAKSRLSFLKKKLNYLSINWLFYPFLIIKSMLATAIKIVIDPGGNFLSCLAKLKSIQSVIYGLIYGIVFTLILMITLADEGIDIFLKIESFLSLFILGIIPFLGLMMLSLVAQLIYRGFFYFVSTIFFAGVSLLPLMGFFILDNLFINDLLILQFVLPILTSCYTLLILYNGCLQVYNFSEKVSAFWSSMMLIFLGVTLRILL